MKKQILLAILTICICTSAVYATVNPSDKYKKKVTYPTTTTTPKATTINKQIPSGDPVKAELDSIARQLLKAAENHQDTVPYQMKFMKKGVDSICPPQIIAKRTPKCPPIKIQVNGRTLSGSKCALTCYQYKGKQYDVGYCK